MGKSEIESWLVGTSADPDDPESPLADGPEWRREYVLTDWPKALEVARTRLLTSSTKVRIQFLREELGVLAKHGDLSLSQIMDIFKLLTLTYPRYVDAPSRETVEEVGSELVRRDELRGRPDGEADSTRMGVIEQILAWLSHEVGLISKRSSSHAASPMFVLLSWTCGLYTTCLDATLDFPSTPSWGKLLGVMAVLIDMLLDKSTRVKAALQKSAMVRTRRSLRSHPEHLSEALKGLLALEKTGLAAASIVPLLGITVDVKIRLKSVKDESLKTLDQTIKADIIAFYGSNVLMSRTPIPAHESTALRDFIANFITPDDFSSVVLPTMEKALLRSPESSLSVTADFIAAYAHSLEGDTFRRVLTSTLNGARSTNAVTRTSAMGLFKAISQKAGSAADIDLAVNELLALPRAGKTAGPDHRLALYIMLGYVSPAATVSPAVVQSAVPLIAKETHDAPIVALASAITPHLLFCLQSDVALPSEVLSAVSKEMASTKTSIRRAFYSLVGDVFRKLGELETEVSFAFAKAVLPALENGLKTVSTSPMNTPAGPLEGYVALAIFLGPLARSGKFGGSMSKNANLQSLVTAGVKPSFLLWDKVYTKLSNAQDEMWLLRAGEASLVYFKTEFMRNEQACAMIGMIFLHLETESVHPQVRRAVLNTLESLAKKVPEIVTRVVIDATTLYLSRPRLQLKVANGSVGDEEGPTVNRESRIPSVLYAAWGFADDCEKDVRENTLINLVVLAHHPTLSAPSRNIWIELCQRARADPNALVTTRLDDILSRVFSSLDPHSKTYRESFTDAAYRALTTLVFVAPLEVLSEVAQRIRADINPEEIGSLNEMDLGVWNTPEGNTYVDVLASKATEEPVKKGKGYKDAQWEAEVRKSLATKRAATSATLSKQDQALVSAQLEKESKIRQRVTNVKTKLNRALRMAGSVVNAHVPELRHYLSEIAALLLRGAFGKAVELVGYAAFNTYMQLANACSQRLDTFRKWVGVATLRSLGVDGIPDDYTLEPLNSLVIRVLYRLRTSSEQVPFDAATFSYAAPLLSQVLNKGGIALTEEDDPLEQVALSLDIVKFHAGEFSDPAYPRLQIICDLIHVIRTQPKLAKEASSALIDIGQAMHTNATRKEMSVLLAGTLYQEVYVRNSCLQALQPFDLTELDWSPELWTASHDEDEQNARLARHLWEDNGLDVPENFVADLLRFLEHDNSYVRTSAAEALADAVIDLWPQSITDMLRSLEDFYRDKAKVLAPEYDAYGMVIASSLKRSDPWPARVASARTLQLLAPAFTPDNVEPFFRFLIQDEALGDRHPDVRRGMLNAGTAVIDLHGASRLAGLIAMFEAQLASTGGSSETADQVKEAVVILFGRVARHLDPSDSRVPQIIERLVEALKTPAEQVQMAVSECLSPLVQAMRTPATELIDRLLDELSNGPKYAARRGAAYGLAGVIKGAGIGAIKEFNIIERLKAASEDKKRPEPRQGAMFAFETFSATLDRLFEPYVIHILPVLLGSFGDSVPDVREAAVDAARVIMANMSGYGVKTILPDLLSGLDEKQWRTKKGSIELIGMMAYCAPRQLSQSLPIVIPRLTGVLTDSHAQVRAAANKSLKQFGDVISNPEIQSLVPVFLKAMVDPAKTPAALSALLKTSFMHYIDHSSLALVVPIIERGLRERGADTKRKAAQIVGNLASLTESKDFVPYLNRLVPMVHVVLVDPVPEARATAAKSLGTLVERLGEVHFPDLVPGLLRTLKTDTSGVDRQGAAQGLSEVLSGLGMERMEGLLPDIIANAQSPRSTVREGFMSLLVYLPATFGTRFQPHLPKIIAPILGGLADAEDYVRDAAMRAGRMIVTNYSNKAIDLLLPELERGLFDPGWRIRQSSITLVGELLFKVSGISGKTEIEGDEEGGDMVITESSRRALVEVLGVERRDRILSALYLARQDTVNVVRQSSIHIWKALVHNTPRTVREILPELLGQIIRLLTTDEDEQQETAGRTVAELTRKSGEKVLAEIVALLKQKSTSTDPKTREGVCLVLCELMESTTDGQREGQEEDIIAMVRSALVDDEADVRAAAAKAFDILQEHIGAKAIDETIPTLLEALRQPGQSSGTALQALKEVMTVRASTVFPVLIPTLTNLPMSVFNARAIASLVTVAGTALSKRLSPLLTALVKTKEDPATEEDEELRSAAEEATRALLASVCDLEGLNTLMLLLLGWAKADSVGRRVSGCELFGMFCEESELDSSLYRVDWVRQLISLLDDSEVPVHTAAWQAFDAFVKSLPKDEMESLIVPLRRTIESTGAPGRHVPGFSLPKGVSPFVPIIIAGLTTGSNEQREQAAYAIGDLVERAEESAIKPFVVPFTGPLIRVATQASTYPPAVKSAILSALATMLEYIPAFVKPFFPQLQRTFVKSASDPASLAVRVKAAQALGMLMRSQPRVDPVITELITGAKSSEDAVAGSMLLALAHVVKSAGANVGEKAREACAELVADFFKEGHDDHSVRSAASLFAALSAWPEVVKPIVQNYLVGGTTPNPLSSHCILAAISPDEDFRPSKDANVFQTLDVLRSVRQKVQESITTEKSNIARPAREASALLKAMDDD